jgi:hypothetical protein
VLNTSQAVWVNTKDLKDWLPTSEGEHQLKFPLTPQLENSGSEFLSGMLWEFMEAPALVLC